MEESEKNCMTRSLNFTTRKRESDRIERENVALARRLLTKPSCIDSRSFQKDFDQHLRLRNLLLRVKLKKYLVMRDCRSGSCVVLPPIDKKAAKAGSSSERPNDAATTTVPAKEDAKPAAAPAPEAKKPEPEVESKKNKASIFITGGENENGEEQSEAKKQESTPAKKSEPVPKPAEKVESGSKSKPKLPEEKGEKSETQNIVASIEAAGTHK